MSNNKQRDGRKILKAIERSVPGAILAVVSWTAITVYQQNADLAQIQADLVRDEKIIEDHEVRIRVLERDSIINAEIQRRREPMPLDHQPRQPLFRKED